MSSKRSRRRPYSLTEFIRENRPHIDNVIRSSHGLPLLLRLFMKITDNDRRLWVMNDEGLYLMAKHQGVLL